MAEDGQTFIDGDDDPVPGHCKSPMLTCWRKLHVETDSMGPEYDTGNSDELGEVMLEDLDKDWDTDQFNVYG